MSYLNKNRIMEIINKYFQESSKEKIEQDLIDSGYYNYVDNTSTFFIENRQFKDSIKYKIERYIFETYVPSSNFPITNINLDIRYSLYNQLNQTYEKQSSILINEDNYEYALAA